MARQAFLFSFFLLIPSLAFAQNFDAGASYEKGLFHTLFGLDHVIAMLSVGLISSQFGGRAIWQVPLVFVVALVIGGATGLILPDNAMRGWLLSGSEIVIMISDLLLVIGVIWITRHALALRAFLIVFGILFAAGLIQLLAIFGITVGRLGGYAIVIAIILITSATALGTNDAYRRVVALMIGFIAIFGLFHGFAHGGEIPDGAIALFYVLGFATTSILMHAIGVGIGEVARAFPQPRVARGIVAAVLLGIAIPYQVDFWNSLMPRWALELFGF